jgi:hypothetical protein
MLSCDNLSGLRDKHLKLRRKGSAEVVYSLGWRFGIRTDLVEGRIRVDSGGFLDPGNGIRQPSVQRPRPRRWRSRSHAFF